MKAPHDFPPDPLDRLLDLSPLPQPDPWFTARTMARCRLSQPADRLGFFRSLRFWSRWALPGLCVLFVAGLSLQQAHRIHTLAIHHQQAEVQEAFEAIASMDTDSDTSSSWLDSSL
jgi:hypothetical protein